MGVGGWERRSGLLIAMRTSGTRPSRCSRRTATLLLTAQSPINVISKPAEAAAAVSTTATARVRKYGPWRRQLEGSGGRDARSCTRCAVGSNPGGRAMGCTSVVARHLERLWASEAGAQAAEAGRWPQCEPWGLTITVQPAHRDTTLPLSPPSTPSACPPRRLRP